jgi:SAM-dependent methyltransferase
MKAPTPWRRLSYKAMKDLCISGKVIDLGGSRNSSYHELFKGSKDITVVNYDDHYGFDLNFDLENKFPLESSSYDTVLCINTLEHILDYRNVLNESYRILKSGSEIIIVVPFIMFFHPCPNDYWRYSSQTLEKILVQSGFNEVKVDSVGKGPFTAALQIVYPVLYFSLVRNIAYGTALLIDWCIAFFQKKNKDRYPLGYIVVAKK